MHRPSPIAQLATAGTADARGDAGRFPRGAAPRRLTALVLLGLAAGPSFADEAPPYCSQTTQHSSVDRLVCATPSLYGLDAENWRLGESARAAATDPSAFDAEKAARWRTREATCVDVACLTNWYADTNRWLASVAAAGPRKASAPSKALIAYEHAVLPYRESTALAHVARACGLRSDAWYTSMTTAYALTKSQAEGEHHVSQAEQDVFNQHEAETDRRVLKANPPADPATCERLRNSAQMDRLDALQRRATGGYH